MDLMARRREIGNSEYTILDHLACKHEKSYINTGLLIKDFDEVITDIFPKNNYRYSNLTGSSPLQSSTSSIGTIVIRTNDAGNGGSLNVNGAWQTKFNSGILRSIWDVLIKSGSQKVYIDGHQVFSSSRSIDYTNNSFPVFLCDINLGGNPQGNPYDGIIYSVMYKLNGIAVRHFVPAKRRDGAIGFFDLCGSICQTTGTPFYDNIGTAPFTLEYD